MGRRGKTHEAWILAFVSTRFRSSRDILRGIYRSAEEQGWQVLPIEEIPSPERVRELMSAWQPRGCLVYSGSTQDLLPRRTFGETPVVYLSDRRPGRLTVNQDAAATVALAVNELTAAGARALAYIGPDTTLLWNRERRRLFRDEARRRHLACRIFELAGVQSTAPVQEHLRTFLQGLPPATGILVACDQFAPDVMLAVKAAGLRIPEDLSLVSVDNDEMICENLRPTLTSIALDFVSAGQLMGDLLADHLNGGKRGSALYQPLGIVRRTSSRIHKYPESVTQAQEYIRLHACEGIGVPDVAAAVGLTRRSLERQFAAAGLSVAETIRAEKLERALALLRDQSLSLDPIADFTGYSNSRLKTLFKERYGKTMRDYRRQFNGG